MKHTKIPIALFLVISFLICLMSGCSSTKGAPPQSSSSNFIASKLEKEPTRKEITITLDNWNTYFEVVEKEEEYKNDYNETEHIRYYYSFDLKDEYTLDEVDIKIDYSYLNTLYSVQEDLTNKKIIWGDVIEGPTEETAEIDVRYDEYPMAGETFLMSGTQKRKCTDIKVNRIYGTLVIMESPSN